MQKDGWRSYRETLAQTRDGGPEEDYVHALPASGSPVFREIRHGGGLHRSDDEARAESQLDLQTYRQVARVLRSIELLLFFFSKDFSSIAVCFTIDFNQDGRPDNISFMIKRVKVHSEDALRDPNYRFPGNYGVEKYLELFSGK